MTTRDAGSFTFTGWHMLGVIGLFFGTIISVNFYMAYQAVHSWSGLVVENTYVASQQFNAKVEQITAIDHDGHEVVMGSRPVWRSVDIPSRLVFPNRMAEDQA